MIYLLNYLYFYLNKMKSRGTGTFRYIFDSKYRIAQYSLFLINKDTPKSIITTSKEKFNDLWFYIKASIFIPIVVFISQISLTYYKFLLDINYFNEYVKPILTSSLGSEMFSLGGWLLSICIGSAIGCFIMILFTSCLEKYIKQDPFRY